MFSVAYQRCAILHLPQMRSGAEVTKGGKCKICKMSHFSFKYSLTALLYLHVFSIYLKNGCAACLFLSCLA